VVGVLVGPGLLWPPGRHTWKAVGLEIAIGKLNLLVPSENLSIHDLFGPGMSMEKTSVE
jgi:hypothetical protein